MTLKHLYLHNCVQEQCKPSEALMYRDAYKVHSVADSHSETDRFSKTKEKWWLRLSGSPDLWYKNNLALITPPTYSAFHDVLQWLNSIWLNQGPVWYFSNDLRSHCVPSWAAPSSYLYQGVQAPRSTKLLCRLAPQKRLNPKAEINK